MSLLDFPPFELPLELASTYSDPSDLSSVISAAKACVHLLEQACKDAADQLGVDLRGPLSEVIRSRLVEAIDIARTDHRADQPREQCLRSAARRKHERERRTTSTDRQICVASLATVRSHSTGLVVPRLGRSRR